MKRFLAMIAAVLALFSVSLAQTGGTGGPDPAMRARMQAYQPVFDLTGRVSLMLEMDKQKGLAITKAQAKTLLPILKDLQTRADLKPKDATTILSKIEDKILTDKQVTWLDDTQLQREEERRQRFQNGGGGAPNAAGAPGAGGAQGAAGGARPGGARGGMFQAISQGKPFNPFKDDRMGKPLADLIALLAKR
jgi:hypothetical protein